MALRLGVDGEEVSKSPTSCFWMILFFFVRFFIFYFDKYSSFL